MNVQCHGITDPGCLRNNNEDRILLEPAGGLYAVCDGMGGHRRGEVAAELAISALQHYIQASRDGFDVTWPFGYDFDASVDGNRLATAVRLANRQVWRRSEESLDHAGMGSTVAALLLHDSLAVVANVGDSRVYLFRAGELSQMTVDDTVVASMVARGLLDPAAVATHPMRNILTQAAGSQQTPDVHLREFMLEPGDRVLLCSDGLHGVIGDDAIRRTMASQPAPEGCALELVAAARAAGAPDNVSAIVVGHG